MVRIEWREAVEALSEVQKRIQQWKVANPDVERTHAELARLENERTAVRGRISDAIKSMKGAQERWKQSWNDVCERKPRLTFWEMLNGGKGRHGLLPLVEAAISALLYTRSCDFIVNTLTILPKQSLLIAISHGVHSGGRGRLLPFPCLMRATKGGVVLLEAPTEGRCDSNCSLLLLPCCYRAAAANPIETRKS
ncbi:hypothetical protein AC1031_004027 [Aphanomyces cochlioides]|nr:hypothetical protein AC1031_004027 [Aphanomyces cochlioides]